MAVSSCGACARPFTSLTAFDEHQDVDYSRVPVVICRDPAAIGMVTDQHGRWHMPGTEEGRARLAALKARRGA
jgi:hypothetical protein